MKRYTDIKVLSNPVQFYWNSFFLFQIFCLELLRQTIFSPTLTWKYKATQLHKVPNLMHLRKHYFQGFPNGVSLWEQFGQNDQKLHGNYKINILGAKQCRDRGDKTITWVVGDPPQPPPPPKKKNTHTHTHPRGNPDFAYLV